MLVTKKEFELQNKSLQLAIKDLQDRYWSLYHKHELLLDHFGLTEITKPETKELRKKRGPEAC